MSGFTNRGKYRIARVIFNGAALPTNFYVALVTSAATPTDDTNTFSQLTEITAGNGYTAGGIALALNVTDFPTLTEDDTNNWGSIAIRTLVWTASGGTLPTSGSGARWAVLTDDNVTQASREIWGYYDLTEDRSVSSGQPLSLTGIEMRFKES